MNREILASLWKNTFNLVSEKSECTRTSTTSLYGWGRGCYTVWTGDLCKLLIPSQRWGRIKGLDHRSQERLEINFCQISIERKYSFSTDWWVVKGNLGSVNINSQRSIEMLAGQKSPKAVRQWQVKLNALATKPSNRRCLW